VIKFPELTVKIRYPTGYMNVCCHVFFPDCTKAEAVKVFRLLRKFQWFNEQNEIAVNAFRVWFEQAELKAQTAHLAALENQKNHAVSLDGKRKRTEAYRTANELNKSLAYDVKQREKLLFHIQDEKKLFQDFFPDDRKDV
jgi:hypothetical protein